MEAPFGSGGARGRRLSDEKVGFGNSGSGFGGVVGPAAESGRRSLSGGEKSSEPTMEEGAKGAAAAVVPAVSPPPVESRTTGGSPAKEAASPEVDKATSTLGSTELTETVVERKGEELAGKAIEVEPPLEAAAGTPEPLPADSKKQPQSAGSVKDDAAGEDLAEEFSDFGDSDEDILNQEDEKESRPVSRISGKSSRSAKEEAGEAAGTSKKEETEEETEASKVRRKNIW